MVHFNQVFQQPACTFCNYIKRLLFILLYMYGLIVYVLTVGKVKEEWPLYDNPLHYV